jgi:hypothetical protein
MKCVLYGVYGRFREQTEQTEQKQAKASMPPIYLCITYRAVKSSAGVPPGFEVRHRVGVAQATVDREPSRGQVQHGGRLGLLANLALSPPRPPHHDALRTLCLVSASWESVGRRDPTARLGDRNPHGSRPPACLPDATKCKCKCTACDSARACPALPDFFFARLLHECAN